MPTVAPPIRILSPHQGKAASPGRARDKAASPSGPSPANLSRGGGGSFLAHLTSSLASAAREEAAYQSLRRYRGMLAELGVDEKKLRQAAEQFEAFMLGMLLRQMYRAVPKAGLFGQSFAHQLFMEMFLDQVGEKLAAAGGVGVGDLVVEGVVRKLASTRRESSTSGSAVSPKQEFTSPARKLSFDQLSVEAVLEEERGDPDRHLSRLGRRYNLSEVKHSPPSADIGSGENPPARSR